MHPGGTCITCHATAEAGEAPQYTIAGTVYPTIREPTDCNGSNGVTAGIQVVVTDAAGRVLTLPVNTVGNFFTTAAVTFPFHARVVRGTVERVMTAAQSTGNCNGCHTETGANGAPGRIVAP
jgi:mono/diheme cytochrome c family protein